MKKIKIIGVFLIFIFSFVSHFMYELFPNTLFSVLFPVNESIWEHMKLIVTPVLIFSLIEYIVYKRKNISYNNFILSYAISMILGIIIYLMIYLPIDYIFGHSMIFAISLLFVIFIIVEIISYYIMNYREIRYSNTIGIILIIFMYVVFGYLTYNPIENDLFYDTQKKIYGIDK